MDWQSAYLRALGVKPTADAKARLASWQRWEGGATNNSATNNYMNTKQRMPGSFDAIGNGVQGYKTLAQGAQAFARTIRNGHYPNLTQWIATGQGDPSQDLQVWVAGPGGVGSPSAVEYAQKVLGTHGGGGTVSGRPTAPQPVTTPSVESPATPASIFTAPSMGDVRSTAAEGFAAIAQGRAKPQDTFAPLLQSLKAMRASAPTVSIPTQAQGGGPVEEKAANLVKKYLGVKYQWGGANPTGFDCSGLLQYVYNSLGVKIPRTTYEQWSAGQPVTDLQPGDAVFFTGSDPMNGKPGHVGMYLGNGKYIAAPHTGSVVSVFNLSDAKDYVGARRFA